MQIFVYESCKYTFPQSVLDNMETRTRSFNAGTFLYTASICLLCVFACWADSMWVTVPAGVVGLLHTQGAQMTSRSPCKYPELRYQTRGKSANVGWDAPINESQTPGVRITIGKGIKELGWSIHEMIAVSHSVWCHTTFNYFCVFHKVLVHHSTTVMWNGDS